MQAFHRNCLKCLQCQSTTTGKLRNAKNREKYHTCLERLPARRDHAARWADTESLTPMMRNLPVEELSQKHVGYTHLCADMLTLPDSVGTSSGAPIRWTASQDTCNFQPNSAVPMITQKGQQIFALQHSDAIHNKAMTKKLDLSQENCTAQHTTHSTRAGKVHCNIREGSFF